MIKIVHHKFNRAFAFPGNYYFKVILYALGVDGHGFRLALSDVETGCLKPDDCVDEHWDGKNELEAPLVSHLLLQFVPVF